MTNYEEQLIELVRSDDRIMGLLRAVRSLEIDQWCIAAGTIRNKVWDHLHGFVEPTLPSDIDVLIYDSIEQAMSRWADLVTAVGVQLMEDDRLQVVAPAGLDDLFNLRVRPNLITPTSLEVYRDRMANKGWPATWPRLQIEAAPS